MSWCLCHQDRLSFVQAMSVHPLLYLLASSFHCTGEGQGQFSRSHTRFCSLKPTPPKPSFQCSQHLTTITRASSSSSAAIEEKGQFIGLQQSQGASQTRESQTSTQTTAFVGPQTQTRPSGQKGQG